MKIFQHTRTFKAILIKTGKLY